MCCSSYHFYIFFLYRTHYLLIISFIDDRLFFTSGSGFTVDSRCASSCVLVLWMLLVLFSFAAVWLSSWFINFTVLIEIFFLFFKSVTSLAKNFAINTSSPCSTIKWIDDWIWIQSSPKKLVAESVHEYDVRSPTFPETQRKVICCSDLTVTIKIIQFCKIFV